MDDRGRKGVAMSEGDGTRAFYARLVTLADTLVTGFDVVDLADELVSGCLEFLPVTSAGIMLDDQRGNLRVLASSSEETRLLELFELQNNEGPCLEAFSTGTMIGEVDLETAALRWPSFTNEAMFQGIRGAYAFPMQLRGRTIGVLNLFCGSREGLDAEQLRIAQVMSTMATLGILNHWTVRRQELLAEQLQTALNSRIVIEQAKGVIAERASVDMSTAFRLLRSSARESRRALSDVAADVAHGQLAPTMLLAGTGQAHRLAPGPAPGSGQSDAGTPT
jgi:hypothetical protein